MGIRFIKKTKVFTDLNTRIRGHYLMFTKEDMEMLDVKEDDLINIGVDEDEPSINILYIVKDEKGSYKIANNPLYVSAPYRVNIKSLIKELIKEVKTQKDYSTKVFSFSDDEENDDNKIRGIKLVSRDFEEV